MEVIEKKRLEQAYEAGKVAHASHRSIGDCPLYAMGEMGRQWRQHWKRGYADACTAAGQPDPLAPPKTENAMTLAPNTGKKQPLRTGRRTGR